MYFDAHTHLNNDTLFPDRRDHVDTFFGQGGIGLVNIGVNHIRNQRACDIAQERATQDKPGHIKATVGIHPGEIAWGNITSIQAADTALQQAKELYTTYSPHIVAIGECGIDSHYERNDQIKDIQVHAFHAQCQRARELNLPVVIHTRDNFPLTMEVLKEYTDLKVYIHCFGYGPQEVQQLMDTFPRLRIGFCGNLTYPKAINLRESLELILAKPEQAKLVLETDAPFLTPQNKRPATNVPAYVIDIYTFAAAHVDMPLEKLQKQVWENIKSLYLPTL